jgi:hypothetical protein
MDSIPVNVVLLPSDELANEAIKASELLAKFGTLFTLKDGSYFPHVSTYMLQLKAADLSKTVELLSDIAHNTSGFSLRATRYYQAKGFTDIEYQKTREIDGLQDLVVNALNPIRDGMREKDKNRMAAASGLVLENFKNYGWNSIGELFRPHLTLTRFNEEQKHDEAEKVLPETKNFDGKFPKLALFEMGDNGTCVRKIFELKLSGQT